MRLRTIHYADIDACIADVKGLHVGYRNGGTWSLEQTCWHLNVPVERSLQEPTNLEPSPEQRKDQAFINQVVTSGWPEGLKAAGEMLPPDGVGSDAVERYITSLQRLRNYQPTHVDAFIFGPVAADTFRQFVLIHAADHLCFMEAE
jgi:hypothetical protein